MAAKARVSVLGDGGWGTALALVCARKNQDVLLWSAFPEYAEKLKEKRENYKFLAGVPLPPNLQISSNLQEALEFGEIIVLAIPTQFLRNVLHKIKDLPTAGKIFVSVSKGIEKKTCLRPSEIIKSILGEKTSLVILSGPSHAEEVARNIPTLVVAASTSEPSAARVQQVFMDTNFRVYVQNDIVGVELGGALKNVIAIAAGVSDGLKFGTNTKSGLLSRGLLEMTRLGIKMGANPNTFFGLSGLGDLMTTCFSEHGRNLKVGQELGSGKKIKDILAGMEMVAEGVDTASSLQELCRKVGIELPIISEVYKILFEDKEPRQAVLDLLHRDAHEEWKQY
ncbi:MAG: NAD(P)-dependent glycerol-3-phosphate dehydrogenase [Candidatus Omnitrophica bacterium]|nr:NAD(P)-dependent glycerol-3-phosphate dehydrogenase [Candidatus Omnitrophota bacterium]